MKVNMLESTFRNLIAKYPNEAIIDELWNEIQLNHSHKKRHYHSLSHLENLLLQLEEVKPQIEDWETILFTLFYHDIIYKATSKNNEEKSAELAVKRMQEIGVEQSKIDKCFKQILATKLHQINDDKDTNIFLDADLSILGSDWEIYQQYYNSVRKEYAIYPDLLYNPGRKKVLQHFLSMKRIYNTNYFYNKFEATANENLKRELEILY